MLPIGSAPLCNYDEAEECFYEVVDDEEECEECRCVPPRTACRAGGPQTPMLAPRPRSPKCKRVQYTKTLSSLDFPSNNTKNMLVQEGENAQRISRNSAIVRIYFTTMTVDDFVTSPKVSFSGLLSAMRARRSLARTRC